MNDVLSELQVSATIDYNQVEKLRYELNTLLKILKQEGLVAGVNIKTQYIDKLK
jgi:hypothetical protein